jgi:hypothetical protein
MTSQINPSNINGAYPVAGQDNNSQGFRDNFTWTKTNFQYAADEISDLQSKVVLKAPLTGTTLNNNMLGSIVSNAVAQNFGLTCVSLGSQSGTVTFNYSAGHYQTLTTTGNVILAFSNLPASGVTGVITVQLTVASMAHQVTLPTVSNAVGIPGYNSANRTISFPAAGTYVFQFIIININGAYAYTVNQVNSVMQPFNNSSELLDTGIAASLTKTISYFTPGSAPIGATLAAGVEGQIKTLIMKSTGGGSMTITVTNAGWSGFGTITFSVQGQACTLQFITGKWFCIGNNGAVFT